MTTAEMEELRKVIREEVARLVNNGRPLTTIADIKKWTEGGFVEVPKKGEFVFVDTPAPPPRGGFF